MSQADELLNSVADENISVQTVDPETEPHIVIGDDRIVTVPKELQRIAVQYDHNIETVTFDCPRYWDGLDMSQMSVRINYKRADKKIGCYKAQNVTVDETDANVMHFDWTVSRNVTEKNGNIVFLVCVKKVDDDYEVNHWNSELCASCYVSEGLECDDETVVNDYPDYLSSLEQEYAASFEALKAELLAAKEAGEFDGEDGASIQSIVRTSGTGAPGTDDIYTITLTDGQTSTFTVYNGTDGVSPTITIKSVTDGHKLIITDVNGAATVNVMNGEDGVSPTITVTTINGGHRLTITDKNGTQSVDVMDGTTEISEAVTQYMDTFVYVGSVEPESGPVLWFDTSSID